MQSKGLNAIHLSALLIGGAVAGAAILAYPGQEAVAALLLTATISAVVLSWTYQSGRFDSDKKEHSQSLNNQFFVWVRRLNLGPSWDPSEKYAYSPSLRISAVESPAPGEPGKTVSEAPVKEMPLFPQAQEHFRAYPDLAKAWQTCDSAVSAYNEARSRTLERIETLVREPMKREYPNLAGTFIINAPDTNWYDRVKAEQLVYLRARREVGDRSAFVDDPYPGPLGSKMLNWRGQAIIVSDSLSDLTVLRLLGALSTAWNDTEVQAGVKRMIELEAHAFSTVSPLAREFSTLSDRLSTGHRILGSCVNGL